ncbi:hypothetical protein D3C84_947200 [compost metagenome]
MGELGTGQCRGDANGFAVAGGALDPLAFAAGNVTPAFKAGLEAALGFTELHQIIGGAHAGDVEEVFELTNTVFPIGIRLADYPQTEAVDLGLVPGQWTDDPQL